ncbi:hypothetical protein ACIRU3_06105 [Streptomyces sp. NPDC101151]|uniref:hypothetical protein n=1 Tax=Streptomyces sp. NPDC101151 TaxID=3366115 RepID=UPI0037F47778
MPGSVKVLVDGRPHELHGSGLDPKGELLQAQGALVPSDPPALSGPGTPLSPPLRPGPGAPSSSPVPAGSGTRFTTWVRRHPVLTALVAVEWSPPGCPRVPAGGLAHTTGRRPRLQRDHSRRPSATTGRRPCATLTTRLYRSSPSRSCRDPGHD